MTTTPMYPCDFGIGGLPMGFHRFVVTEHGVCCSLCGKTPPQPEPLTSHDSECPCSEKGCVAPCVYCFCGYSDVAEAQPEPLTTEFLGATTFLIDVPDTDCDICREPIKAHRWVTVNAETQEVIACDKAAQPEGNEPQQHNCATCEHPLEDHSQTHGCTHYCPCMRYVEQASDD